MLNKLISKIHKRNYEDISMFWYVKGQRDIMPAITIEKAMYNYFKAIGEDDFNIESRMTIYSRMQKEIYESSKTNI
jgi:hypothetical protein